jgi:hypothetical protein
LDEACCSWKQKFNVLNLTLGRNFFISKYLTLKPHVGMNSAWITETYKIGYVPTPNSNDPRDPDGIFLTNIINHIEVEQKQSLWGIGLRGGIDTMWHINRSFAFYGDLSLTTFWGRFHVRNSDVVSESVSGTYKTLNINYKVHTVIPVIETGFGLAYITWFNEDRLRLQVQLGWEHQIWTDFNYFTQGQGNGSLALQGMTLKGGLTF